MLQRINFFFPKKRRQTLHLDQRDSLAQKLKLEGGLNQHIFSLTKKLKHFKNTQLEESLTEIRYLSK